MLLARFGLEEKIRLPVQLWLSKIPMLSTAVCNLPRFLVKALHNIHDAKIQIQNSSGAQTLHTSLISIKNTLEKTDKQTDNNNRSNTRAIIRTCRVSNN